MRVLLDECVDWRLIRDIVGHDVKTARQMGWTTLKNGELLTLAGGQFDVFVTVDRNLSFQQKVVSYPDRRYRASRENEPPCRSQATCAKACGGHSIGAARRRRIY